MNGKGKRRALYPGTFDPITNGHTDVIRRAARLVDHLVVVVANNQPKGPLFSIDERVAMVKAEVEDIARQEGTPIDVIAFDSLLVNLARAQDAKIIIRGLRTVSDFDFEFQLTGNNACLAPDIETLFLMASVQYQFVSSRFVKEIGRLGGDISFFVSPRVQDCLVQKFQSS